MSRSQARWGRWPWTPSKRQWQWQQQLGAPSHFTLGAPALDRRSVTRVAGRVWSCLGHALWGRVRRLESQLVSAEACLPGGC